MFSYGLFRDLQSPPLWSLAPLLPSRPAPPSPWVCILYPLRCLSAFSPLASSRPPALPGCPPLLVCAKGTKRGIHGKRSEGRVPSEKRDGDLPSAFPLWSLEPRARSWSWMTNAMNHNSPQLKPWKECILES